MIDKKNNFKIQYTKGDTYALKITLNNVTEAVTTAFFTVKENMDDTTPVIQKTLNAGISLIEDNLYKNQLVYKLQLQVEDSEYLQPDFQYLYDLKITLGNVVKTVISGNFVVDFNVTSVEQIITTLADIEVDGSIETDAETTPATQGIEYEQDPVAMAKIGDITQLNTTAKNNLVSAINEVNAKATASAEEIAKIENGTVTVPEATYATTADNATNATHAISATSATNATKLTTSIITFPYIINHTGLYAVVVTNAGAEEFYTIMLSIEDLTKDFRAVGAYYNGSYDYGVNYNESDNTITADEELDIYKIRLITQYD